jgi:hypothetical protein
LNRSAVFNLNIFKNAFTGFEYFEKNLCGLRAGKPVKAQKSVRF